MADIRAEIDKETELLSNTLESINKRNKKFFDTWDAMMKKLTAKRKLPGGNRNRRSRTKTVNDQKETKFNLLVNFAVNLLLLKPVSKLATAVLDYISVFRRNSNGIYTVDL